MFGYYSIPAGSAPQTLKSHRVTPASAPRMAPTPTPIIQGRPATVPTTSPVTPTRIRTSQATEPVRRPAEGPMLYAVRGGSIYTSP